MASAVNGEDTWQGEGVSLLDELRRQGIHLWVEGGQLRFRAPDGVMTAALAGRLREHKAGLLTHLGRPSAEAVTRVPDRPDYGVSHAQRRMWFLSQLEAASAAYNVPLRLLLEGPVDPGALETALRRLEERHEALRTTVIAREGEPRQVIRPPGERPLRLSVLDFSDDASPEERAREFADADAAEPFDIARGPLWRAALLRVGPGRGVLCLTAHHLVCDGWSLRVMMRDLSAFYGEEPLEPLPIQYRDYADWQGRVLASDDGRARREYWQAKLGGTLPVLDLPRDFPRPADQSFHGRVAGVRFGADETRRLADFARGRQCSVFTVLLTLVKVLLHRHTGQRDVIVGTAVAGRGPVELERQVGCYINLLALRSPVEPAASFETVLREVRRTMMEALDHQDYPFDHLIDALRQPRDFGRSPLFDVMVVSQTAAELSPALGELRASHLPQAARVSKFDLTFDCEEGPDFVHIGIEYATDLFTAGRIDRLGEHLRQLMRDALAHPDKTVGRLNLLSDDEYDAVVRRHNRTMAPPPRMTTLARIADTVRGCPERLAVACGGERWTYARLWERSGEIAAALRASGLGSGGVAGVLVERSPDLLAALLGVWRAGAAYLPLDPTYPPERLAAMREDSGAALVVCDALSRPFLPPGGGYAVLGLDEALPTAENPASPTTDDLAYLIYTSGSTGRPKGVEISHGALANFLAAMAERPGFGSGDALLAVTTVCFDIAALELFLPLCEGGRVVIASREEAADGAALRALLHREEITVLQATPATWRALLAAGWEGSRKLRALCGGEALAPDLAAQLLARAGTLWNLYGPTETTVWSAARQVAEPSPTRTASVEPIGGPIANTQLYSLDASLSPVPLGVPGELYIGGSGMARGYRGRPDLTAERFLPDPFSTVPGARMYRTGDLVRLAEDGTFDFLGRGDHQVKIRGFRIELGDIEAALSAHTGIARAIVTARADPTGETALAAYLVPRNGCEPSDLREHLAGRLPHYMVPAAFVFLPRLPLTPNGKVDRRALPSPWTDGAAAGQSSRERVAPRTGAERRLAALWSDVLGVAEPGVHDNFFELGGHSLRAVKIIAAIQRDFGVTVALRDFFARPTVAQLALSLETAAPPAPAPVRPRIGRAVPLTFTENLEPAGIPVPAGPAR